MSLEQEISAMQNVLEVGKKAFTTLQHFTTTGEWQPFLNFVTEDVSMVFPLPEPLGGTKFGKAELEKLLRTLSKDLNLRVKHTTKTPMINTTSFAIEFMAKGTLGEEVLERFIILVFEIQGDKVFAIREYALS